MTNTYTSLGYPHWLLIVGALLLLAGAVGLALRRRTVEADSDDIASDQEPYEPETDLTPVEVYERTAKAKRKARWADREPELEDPANEESK